MSLLRYLLHAQGPSDSLSAAVTGSLSRGGSSALSTAAPTPEPETEAGTSSSSSSAAAAAAETDLDSSSRRTSFNSDSRRSSVSLAPPSPEEVAQLNQLRAHLALKPTERRFGLRGAALEPAVQSPTGTIE